MYLTIIKVTIKSIYNDQLTHFTDSLYSQKWDRDYFSFRVHFFGFTPNLKLSYQKLNLCLDFKIMKIVKYKLKLQLNCFTTLLLAIY